MGTKSNKEGLAKVWKTQESQPIVSPVVVFIHFKSVDPAQVSKTGLSVYALTSFTRRQREPWLSRVRPDSLNSHWPLLQYIPTHLVWGEKYSPALIIHRPGLAVGSTGRIPSGRSHRSTIFLSVWGLRVTRQRGGKMDSVGGRENKRKGGAEGECI